MKNTSKKPARLRHEYSRDGVIAAKAPRDPLRLFGCWFDEAVQSKAPMPNAMTLATVSADGRPHARIVLLKDFSRAGFTFFTNYESAKGREIAGNRNATLVFYWPSLERQIRLEGTLTKTAARISDAYFQSRPRNYQIGAWVSNQSRVLKDPAVLEKRYEKLEEKFRGTKVPRPPHWGGYSLNVRTFEFWHGKANRLHDRLLYKKTVNGWKNFRLEP